MGSWNDVMADSFGDLKRGMHARIYRHLHGGDLPAEAYRNQPGADLFNAEQFDLGGLGRRVGRFDDSNEPARLDQSYRGH